MQDLTAEFVALARIKRARGSTETEALVRKLEDAFAGTVDWDTDAGEDWATVFDDRSMWAAIVYAQAPLVICRDAMTVRGVTPSGVSVIEVSDRDAPVLTASPQSLEALFAVKIDYGEFEAAKFAASDLWFWTI